MHPAKGVAILSAQAPRQLILVWEREGMKTEIVNYFNGNYLEFYDKYLPSTKPLTNGEHQALCPFHTDTNPSLSFNDHTGKFYCHGCDKKGDIFHFYGKINDLNTGREFGKVLHGIADDFGIQKPKSKMVKTYDYVDAEGKRLFQACRFEPKRFSQRRPDGNGKWIWDLKGVQRVLYKQKNLQKADEVIIVEGEKDVDNLLNLGFTATTNPMGAKKWQPEYDEVLKGKRVILIPDNDSVGFEHMAQVGASLAGKTQNLKWLELPSKGDVSDFINTFSNKEEASEKLSILIENAKPYSPPKKVTIDDIILTTDSFKNLDVEQKRELLFPWLKEDSINLVSGFRGTGKTWLALGILDAVTRGSSFGTWECKRSVPCLFLDGEMTIADDLERIDNLKLDSVRENPLYFYSDAYANQLGLPKAHLANDKWRQTMKRILLKRKVKLLVLDNLASLASGLDENKKSDWDAVNTWLLELRFAGISTIMLHHVNKSGGQRGTSAR